jgi:hypothetical protein
MEDNIIDGGTVKLKPGPKPKELVEGNFLGIPVGRDKKIIDPLAIEKLAAISCTDRDIADFVGINEDTLRYNFKDNLLKGRAEVRINLRRAQIDLALNGNATMLIWLGKNILGQSDTPITSETNKVLPYSDNEDGTDTSTTHNSSEPREV